MLPPPLKTSLLPPSNTTSEHCPVNEQCWGMFLLSPYFPCFTFPFFSIPTTATSHIYRIRFIKKSLKNCEAALKVLEFSCFNLLISSSIWYDFEMSFYFWACWQLSKRSNNDIFKETVVTRVLNLEGRWWRKWEERGK